MEEGPVVQLQLSWPLPGIKRLEVRFPTYLEGQLLRRLRHGEGRQARVNLLRKSMGSDDLFAIRPGQWNMQAGPLYLKSDGHDINDITYTVLRHDPGPPPNRPTSESRGVAKNCPPVTPARGAAPPVGRSGCCLWRFRGSGGAASVSQAKPLGEIQGRIPPKGKVLRGPRLPPPLPRVRRWLGLPLEEGLAWACLVRFCLPLSIRRR